MRRFRPVVWAALLCLQSSGGAAQTLRPWAPGPDASHSPPSRELATLPLPTMINTEWDAPVSQGPSPATGLTLAELERWALGQNPTLALAAAQIAAARGRYVQAGLYPNPVAGYLGGEVGNEGRAGQQGGFVSQEVVTAGKRQLGRDVAAHEIQQSELAWEAQRQRILTDVRSGFYDVLVAQLAVELTSKLASIGEASLKSAESLMKEQEVGRGDVLQARIESDSAKILLERARNRCAAAWRHLAAVVGDSTLEPRPLIGDVQDGLIPLIWEDALARLMSQSPELAEAEAGMARAQATLRRELAGRYPNIDLQAAVQYDHATRDAISGIEVGVPVPIYNRNQGNIHRAQAELTAARNNVERIRLALQQRLGRVFEEYANALYQVQKFKQDILPNAEASLQLTKDGYRLGEFSYLSLLTAQRTFFQTNLAYLEAIRDLRVSAAVIEGNLLNDNLQSGVTPERGSSRDDAGGAAFGVMSNLFEPR